MIIETLRKRQDEIAEKEKTKKVTRSKIWMIDTDLPMDAPDKAIFL